MTSIPFVYPEHVLQDCATSSVVDWLLLPEAMSTGDSRLHCESPASASPTTSIDLTEEDQSCLRLWKRYNAIYDKSQEDPVEGALKRCMAENTDGNLVPTYEIASRRLEAFLQSVAFVYAHNNKSNKGSPPTTSHRVSLNRFSDMVETATLFSEEDSTAAAHPTLRHRKLVSAKHAKMRQVPFKEMRIPMLDRQPFQVSATSSLFDGALLSIKRSRYRDMRYNRGSSHESSHIEDAVASSDNYVTYLNWATTENPDGVGIVHDAFDQLSCGSCWAFAASGSLEASAARRTAYVAYETFRTSHRDMAMAKQIAQDVQRRSMQVLNLSVQELLDCDSITDQGCVGGNPLLAFYYIHQNGLVGWEDYPYAARQQVCMTDETQNPVATVQSWGVIEADHESQMEAALRYIGPIAVGINGDNSEFLSYDSGIFDNPDCRQKANHALLVVGYGQEETSVGETVRYWIARNSWGTGWGENGYVRIKRGDGGRGVPGVCGIARSPSVALGGRLLRDEDYVFDSHFGTHSFNFEVVSLCADLGLSGSNTCMKVTTWMDRNRALVLGITGILCGLLAFWPLSLGCRRRRRRRKLIQQRRLAGEKRSPPQGGGDTHPSESTPLLSAATGPETITEVD